jgi:hypothetical protein
MVPGHLREAYDAAMPMIAVEGMTAPERFLACGRKSVGVVAVTVAQVEAQGLKAHEDMDVPADDPHALIDFNGKTDDEARRARTQLTLLAQGH